MVKEVCGQVDLRIHIVQHAARLQSIQVLVPELLIWVLYLRTRLLAPPLCLEVKLLFSQHSLYAQSMLAHNTAQSPLSSQGSITKHRH